jgi:hypothetical protein
MMNGLHNGWGMGGYSWIIGLIVLVVLIWVIIKVVNRTNKPNQVIQLNFLRGMMLPLNHHPNDVITETGINLIGLKDGK